MTEPTPDGWDESAAAWIAELGVDGDYGRRFVLDAPMVGRISGRGFRTALDVGCGEGRFCRILRAEGVRAVGVDPTEAFIRRARQLDPEGEYRIGQAETLDVANASFDLVVSYLTLIDIADVTLAVTRMFEALRPGGTLLIANLTSFGTAGMPDGWISDGGELRFRIDHYLEERAKWATWRGIRVRNWHRPLSAYMALLLDHGLELRHFAEPSPIGGDPGKPEQYRRVPFFYIMEWRKPAV